jgi:hypothetical protein
MPRKVFNKLKETEYSSDLGGKYYWNRMKVSLKLTIIYNLFNIKKNLNKYLLKEFFERK